jgi:hypothetical protein
MSRLPRGAGPGVLHRWCEGGPEAPVTEPIMTYTLPQSAVMIP